MMSQRVSRRSALKVASGASFLATWFLAGCSNTEEAKDETGKAQSLEDSVNKNKRSRKNGAPAEPAPTQRVKSGRE
jgi:outer membrane murein-binding lipoprotein Lpp